jgi:hypothetical protein
MQLKSTHIAPALSLLVANLLAQPAMAQDAEAIATPDIAAPVNAYDETSSELGGITVDTAILFYKEDGGRVQAIEPVTGVTYNAANGAIYSGKFTYDTLTGASANGATRAAIPQTFMAPIDNTGGSEGSDSSTGASGTYITPAGKLPVDKGFKDHREAVDLGVTWPVTERIKFSAGGSASWETDYTSYSGRASISADLNNKNTNLSLGVNFEHNQSKPFYGIPTGLAGMGESTVGTSRTKNVFNVVAGVTQVLTPNWLVQLNYSFGRSTGYHTDPYKLVSLIDPSSGDPFWYIYEKRPDKRVRHSVYLGTKLAIGSLVTDASARYYHDDWGVDSLTFELSEHVPVGRSFYVEPTVRYYHQSAAKFFRHYLMLDEPTPSYVSADSRLDKFDALTFGIKAGAHISDKVEVYGAAERYVQYGKTFDRSAQGNLAKYDLFGGTKSFSLITGVRIKFR